MFKFPSCDVSHCRFVGHDPTRGSPCQCVVQGGFGAQQKDAEKVISLVWVDSWQYMNAFGLCRVLLFQTYQRMMCVCACLCACVFVWDVCTGFLSQTCMKYCMISILKCTRRLPPTMGAWLPFFYFYPFFFFCQSQYRVPNYPPPPPPPTIVPMI